MFKTDISVNNKLISHISKTIYTVCLIFIIYTFYENRYQIFTLSEKLSINIIIKTKIKELFMTMTTL